MDRPALRAAASLPSIDDASTMGWDARTVWQERVRDPQLGVTSIGTSARMVREDESRGWDPLETWRLRIQRPRQHRG